MTGRRVQLDYTSGDILAFLRSPIYDGALAPEHREDLHRSTITNETITLQKIRSIPPNLIDQLAGFNVANARSAYILPFPAPGGG